MLNVGVITNFKDADGRTSRYQICSGNGHYYSFKMEIGEPGEEWPSELVEYILQHLKQLSTPRPQY
jgi:hypothetical protein